MTQTRIFENKRLSKGIEECLESGYRPAMRSEINDLMTRGEIPKRTDYYGSRVNIDEAMAKALLETLQKGLYKGADIKGHVYVVGIKYEDAFEKALNAGRAQRVILHER